MKSPAPFDFDPSAFDLVRHIASEFPGTEDGLSHHGTPAVKVRGRLLCRLHEDGVYISIRMDFALREKLLEDFPEYFHLFDHYRKYPYLCMWTDCCDSVLIRAILYRGWRMLASRWQLKGYTPHPAIDIRYFPE